MMKYYQIWKPGKQVSLMVTLTCDLAFILFGVEQGIVGIIITEENFLNQFGNPAGSYLGIIVSIYTLACFFGCLVNYYIGDRLGRKATICVSMLIIILGVALQCTAYTVPHLMVARFITGLGTGMETSTVPMYQAELSKPQNRGRLVCSEITFIGFGLMYAYWLNYGMSYVQGPVSWRVPIATQVIFAASVFVLTFTVPESPEYLHLRGRVEEAKQTLLYIYDVEETDPVFIRAFRDVEEAYLIESQQGAYKWTNLFKEDNIRTRYRVFLSVFVMFAQQLGGINLVNYYITTVLQQTIGLEKTLSMILSGMILVTFTIGSLVPTFGADKLGRRLPMVIGSCGCGICYLAISVLLSYQTHEDIKKQVGSAAVGFFFGFELVYGATVNSLPWVIVPELLPLQARSKGTAIGIASSWLWNFFIVEITPVLIEKLGWKAYIIFTCSNLAFAPVFFFFYPETKGLSLEAIDELFIENRTIFMGLVSSQNFLNDLESEDSPEVDLEKPTVTLKE